MIDLRLAAFGARAIDFEALPLFEHREYFAHGLGAIAGARRKLQTDPIGLELGVTTVTLHPCLRTEVGQIADRARTGVDRRSRSSERREHAARHLLLRVLLRHVRDFVTEYGSEFRLRIQMREQAASHVDVAATGGEGVDRIVVEHDELELGVGHAALTRHALSDFGDVILQRLIAVDAIGLEDLVVGFLCRRARLGGGFLCVLRERANAQASEQQRDERRTATVRT